MTKKIRAAVILFMVLSLILLNSITVLAWDSEVVPILEEIELPSDLNFTISESCTGHAYFGQATANEDGFFAVYALHVNPNDLDDVDFKKKYIDIYMPDGTLLQEVSFTSPLELVVELDGNQLIIYFYTSILIYDITTQELHHYSVSKGAAKNAGIFKQLRSREFTVGEWKYSCKKGIEGYIELTRTNGEQEQVLLQMPGRRGIVEKVIIPGCVSGGIIVLLGIYQNRRRKKKT